jgi:hypothetical protein
MSRQVDRRPNCRLAGIAHDSRTNPCEQVALTLWAAERIHLAHFQPSSSSIIAEVRRPCAASRFGDFSLAP